MYGLILIASRNVSYRRQFHAKVGAYAAVNDGLCPWPSKPENLPQQALFTEPWLSNPALGLASPERVLSSLGTAEGSPEPPPAGGGARNWAPFRRG